MNVVLKIGYIGTAYHGFQKQTETGDTIQGILEGCLGKLQGREVKVMASGRTDAGVHARGQMVQFRGIPQIEAGQYPFILNNMLPEDIRVYKGVEAEEGFHVRYSALEKTYRYRMDLNKVPALYTLPFALHVPFPVDPARMSRALEALPGTHDFTAYTTSLCEVEDCVRRLARVELTEEGGGILALTVTGDGFLHNMVRIIAGTMLDIGRGKLQEEAFRQAFERKERNLLGRTAAAKGLTLEGVRYKEVYLND